MFSKSIISQIVLGIKELQDQEFGDKLVTHVPFLKDNSTDWQMKSYEKIASAFLKIILINQFFIFKKMQLM